MSRSVFDDPEKSAWTCARETTGGRFRRKLRVSAIRTLFIPALSGRGSNIDAFTKSSADSTSLATSFGNTVRTFPGPASNSSTAESSSSLAAARDLVRRSWEGLVRGKAANSEDDEDRDKPGTRFGLEILEEPAPVKYKGIVKNL